MKQTAPIGRRAYALTDGVGVGVIIPLRIVSVANLREHWRAKAKRNKSQKAFAKMMLTGLIGPWQSGVPKRVTLTRIAPRTLDSDNLSSAFKATRDAVADYLGMNDKLDIWSYAQRRGEVGEYGVEIRIEVAEGKVA